MNDILDPADKPRIQVVYMTKPSRKIVLKLPYLDNIPINRRDAMELIKELYQALDATDSLNKEPIANE